MGNKKSFKKQIDLACDRFAAIAEQYCKLIESRVRTSQDAFLRKLLRLLPTLIAAGASLPDVRPETEHPLDRVVAQEQWSALYESLGKKFGKHNLYWQVYDPTKEEKPTPSSLADDLADIYCDLKSGLVALEKKISKREVVWQWRFGFSYHWGAHATDALRAIYRLRFD